MNEYTLTLLDTTGTQDYIFGSNRLQENIGASELVFQATSLWAFQALEEAGITEHNISDPGEIDWDFNGREIENDPRLQAEVIQAVGGNTIVIFRDQAQSRRFVEALTLRLLQEAPGLTILAQHLNSFTFGEGKLPKALEQLNQKMQEHKLSRLLDCPTLGLGVTAVCESTGLPAVTTLAGKKEVHGELEPFGLDGEDLSTCISSQVAAKRAWRKQANVRLARYLEKDAHNFKFPYDLDKIGRIKGEESYIAVVHADGNRMRDLVREATAEANSDREWITKRRDFSKKIQSISLLALKEIVGLVVQAVNDKAIPFEEENGHKYLPFRPLVFGGDDVTFVCSGLIGVSLAAAYLKAFQREAKAHGMEGVFASAGISIVKLHYPFSRAYQLSEKLTERAKCLTREQPCSALDWHFAQSGLSGSLKVIRNREYRASNGSSLCLRPLYLDHSNRSWQKFEQVLVEFQNDYWGSKHNKVIGLLEHLRKGEQSVEQYRLDFDLNELPDIAGDEDARRTGWQGNTCWYFDAVELLDHFVPLK